MQRKRCSRPQILYRQSICTSVWKVLQQMTCNLHETTRHMSIVLMDIPCSVHVSKKITGKHVLKIKHGKKHVAWLPAIIVGKLEYSLFLHQVISSTWQQEMYSMQDVLMSSGSLQVTLARTVFLVQLQPHCAIDCRTQMQSRLHSEAVRQTKVTELILCESGKMIKTQQVPATKASVTLYRQTIALCIWGARWGSYATLLDLDLLHSSTSLNAVNTILLLQTSQRLAIYLGSIQVVLILPRVPWICGLQKQCQTSAELW